MQLKCIIIIIFSNERGERCFFACYSSMSTTTTVIVKQHNNIHESVCVRFLPIGAHKYSYFLEFCFLHSAFSSFASLCVILTESKMPPFIHMYVQNSEYV